MRYKVVLNFESLDEILNCDHSHEATEQYFLVVLFITLHILGLTFESVHKILKCDRSNESLVLGVSWCKACAVGLYAC